MDPEREIVFAAEGFRITRSSKDGPGVEIAVGSITGAKTGWGMMSVQAALWGASIFGLLGYLSTQMAWDLEALKTLDAMIGGYLGERYIVSAFAAAWIVWILVLWFRPGLEVWTDSGDRLFLRLDGLSRKQVFEAKVALDAVIAKRPPSGV
jgi:hypothetical protein